MRDAFTRWLRSRDRGSGRRADRACAVAGAALAVCVLAGCGDELDEFRDDLRPLEGRAAERRSAIAAQLRSIRLGSDRDAEILRAHAAELSKTYDQIAALEPPGEYEEPFTTYVKANSRLVRDLGRFAGELAAGDEAGLRRSGRDIQAALSQSQSARLRWLE